jgi:hypothetical protein
MTKTIPGGEFGGAWEALAAARPRRRSRSVSEWALYTTSELISDVESDQLSDIQRESMRAEISRRLNKKRG